MVYNCIDMENTNSISHERARLKSLLERYEYGRIPPSPAHLSTKTAEIDKAFAAGKAELISFEIICYFDDEGYSFPITAAIPANLQRHAAFIHIKSSSDMPDRHQPTEELCDGGFAVFTIAEEAIFGEDRDRVRGIARGLASKSRRLDSPGRAAILAWCAMRLMDAIPSTFPTVDLSRTAVLGHGIYGISALLAGAFDERFANVISSSSGFGGAASVLYEHGKLYELKLERPKLFCPRYYRLSGREDELPFDQDALLALIAPRRLFLDNADDFTSHAPLGELASAYRASIAYERMGKVGLLCAKNGNPCEDFDENEPLYLAGGNIVYRKREGMPYLCREDFAEFMKFINERGD